MVIHSSTEVDKDLMLTYGTVDENSSIPFVKMDNEVDKTHPYLNPNNRVCFDSNQLIKVEKLQEIRAKEALARVKAGIDKSVEIAQNKLNSRYNLSLTFMERLDRFAINNHILFFLKYQKYVKKPQTLE